MNTHAHSERSTASLRLSAAKNERFFATLRMTYKSRLIALNGMIIADEVRLRVMKTAENRRPFLHSP